MVQTFSRTPLLLLLTLSLLLVSGCHASPAPDPVPSPTPETAAAPDLVLRNATVIDGTGAPPLRDGVIAIRDGLIVAIGSGSRLELPGAGRVVDLRKETVLPGIVDGHVHTAGIDLNPERLERLWLQQGVTALCDMGSPLDLLGGRSRLAAQGYHAPEMVFSGPIITAPGGYPVPIWGAEMAYQVDGVEAARQAAGALLDEAVDLLMIAVDRGPDGASYPTLSAEQVQAIVETAHSRGARVFAHVTRVEDAQTAVENGVDGLSPVPVTGALPDSLIAQMVRRKVWLVPALAAWDGLARERGLSAGERAGWLETGQDNVLRFARAGGRLALGSDYGGGLVRDAGIRPGMPLPDMQLLQKSGLTAMEVIVAATRDAAAACGLGDRLGTLAPGKQADLIVVAGNPLDDLKAMDRITAVIRGGEVIVEP